ncbi:MAG: DinB family protein [Chloroflexi bacterium]|nr:DinB family protein [Chloroflexota bacterium]
MDLDRFISQMADNAQRIRIFVEGASDHQVRWRPTPDSWSILEVIMHLFDEEKEDFRVFLDVILHHPDSPRPKINPQGWVTEHNYNEQDPQESLQGFLTARKESLLWLKNLSSPNWETIYNAPFGPIRAGDVFASWVAHDLLHTRQLLELHWAYTTLGLDPYKVDYAGSW